MDSLIYLFCFLDLNLFHFYLEQNALMNTNTTSTADEHSPDVSRKSISGTEETPKLRKRHSLIRCMESEEKGNTASKEVSLIL